MLYLFNWVLCNYKKGMTDIIVMISNPFQDVLLSLKKQSGKEYR